MIEKYFYSPNGDNLNMIWYLTEIGNEYIMKDATAKTIFFQRQAEKSQVFMVNYLQKLTFCRLAMRSQIENMRLGWRLVSY